MARPLSKRRSDRVATPTPTDLEEVLDALGLEVGRSTGDEVWAVCPAHERRIGKADTRPTNFSVNRDTGQFHCFSCGYDGELVRLVSDVAGLDLWAALDWLGEHGASFTDAVARVGSERTKKQEPLDDVPLEARFAIYRDVPDEVLANRNLTREGVDHFDIRWDNDQRRWVLPVALPSGKLLGWQFKGNEGVKNYPYGMAKRTTLFGIAQFQGKRAILVESPLDVVRLWDCGYDGAVSSFGVHVDDQQLRLIVHVADEVVLALDNDDAGRAETQRIVRQAHLYRRLPVRLFNYGASNAKDVGEMDDDAIDHGIRYARSLYAVGA